jgi:hypothetical protein
VTRACDRKRNTPSYRPPPVEQARRFREVIELSREEVFEICGRLALGHQSLVRTGDNGAANELALVFDVLERRLTA